MIQVTLFGEDGAFMIECFTGKILFYEMKKFCKCKWSKRTDLFFFNFFMICVQKDKTSPVEHPC